MEVRLRCRGYSRPLNMSKEVIKSDMSSWNLEVQILGTTLCAKYKDPTDSKISRTPKQQLQPKSLHS